MTKGVGDINQLEKVHEEEAFPDDAGRIGQRERDGQPERLGNEWFRQEDRRRRQAPEHHERHRRAGRRHGHGQFAGQRCEPGSGLQGLRYQQQAAGPGRRDRGRQGQDGRRRRDDNDLNGRLVLDDEPRRMSVPASKRSTGQDSIN